MARRIINLKYAATCADCGADLEVGAPARYYGRGKVYGTQCHADTRQQPQADAVPAQQAQPRWPNGAQVRRLADPVIPIDTNTLANAGQVIDLAARRHQVESSPPGTHIETCDGDSVIVPDFDDSEFDGDLPL